MMVRVLKLMEILSGRTELLIFQRLHALVLVSVVVGDILKFEFSTCERNKRYFDKVLYFVQA